jgi:hypothetical protein
MNGLGESLKSQAKQNKIFCYLTPFTEELNVPLEQVQHLCERRDWPGLVEFLMNK